MATCEELQTNENSDACRLRPAIATTNDGLKTRKLPTKKALFKWNFDQEQGGEYCQIQIINSPYIHNDVCSCFRNVTSLAIV